MSAFVSKLSKPANKALVAGPPACVMVVACVFLLLCVTTSDAAGARKVVRPPTSTTTTQGGRGDHHVPKSGMSGGARNHAGNPGMGTEDVWNNNQKEEKVTGPRYEDREYVSSDFSSSGGQNEVPSVDTWKVFKGLCSNIYSLCVFVVYDNWNYLSVFIVVMTVAAFCKMYHEDLKAKDMCYRCINRILFLILHSFAYVLHSVTDIATYVVKVIGFLSAVCLIVVGTPTIVVLLFYVILRRGLLLVFCRNSNWTERNSMTEINTIPYIFNCLRFFLPSDLRAAAEEYSAFETRELYPSMECAESDDQPDSEEEDEPAPPPVKSRVAPAVKSRAGSSFTTADQRVAFLERARKAINKYDDFKASKAKESSVVDSDAPSSSPVGFRPLTGSVRKGMSENCRKRMLARSQSPSRVSPTLRQHASGAE